MYLDLIITLVKAARVRKLFKHESVRNFPESMFRDDIYAIYIAILYFEPGKISCVPTDKFLQFTKCYFDC
jgi:hypothetical protein